MSPNDIDARLAAMEARTPGGGEPPGLPVSGLGRRMLLPSGLAAGLLLAVAATAAAGGAIVATLAQGAPGVQNSGQPLAGANLECMSPPDAAAYLTAHGFTDVVWQIESGRDATKGDTNSVQRSSPPDHGYVIAGSILSDGLLYMIVDQREDATGTGACPDLPMP